MPNGPDCNLQESKYCNNFNQQSIAQRAVQNGENGLSCSEAILVTYENHFGITKSIAMKIASGFGGGMGLMGETCGAITAAYMVLGLYFGAESIDDSFARQHVYIQVAEFSDRFKLRRRSLLCRELCVGHSMSTASNAKKLRASGLPSKMIKTAAEILEELITEAQ